MAIVEAFIKIKEYSAHSFIPAERRFIGLRDTEAYKKLSLELLVDMNQDRKKLGDDKIRFLQDAYDWKEDSTGSYTYREMKKGLDVIDKACLWSVFDSYVRACGTQYLEVRNSKEYKQHPPALPDEKSLKDVRDKYVDVFRKDARSGKVNLRCEYYADQMGLLKNVPVQNLSDNRQPEGTGSDHFAIPANERCWILLTQRKLTAKRLEEIRRRLEVNGSCDRVMEIPMIAMPISGGSSKHLYDHLRAIQEKKKAQSEIPASLYEGKSQLENVVMDVNGPPGYVTVLLTDYAARLKDYRSKFDEYSKAVDSYIGRKTGDSEKNLKYLVCSTSAVREKWDCIAETRRDSSIARKNLRKEYTEFEDTAAKLARVTETLAWWITRPQVSETFYDDLYACSDNKYSGGIETLFKEYSKNLQGLSEAPGSFESLTEYCESALKAYEAALVTKNDPKGKSTNMAQKLDEFWNPKARTSSLDFNFKLLEIYKNSVKPPEFFLEVAYPQAKTAKDIALGMLECMAKPIVWADGRRFGKKLPDHLAAWMKMLSKDRQVVISEYTPGTVVWGSKRKLPPVTIVCTTRERTSASECLEGASLTSLKKAMAAIDTILIAKKISEEGLSLSSSIELLKSAVDFAEAWKLLEGGETGGTVSRESISRTGMAIDELPLSKITGILDIVLGAIDFYELQEKGDMDAAVIRGIGKMSIAAAGLFIANPEILLFLIIAGIAIDIAGNMVLDDDYMRWIEFSKYGKRYASCEGKDWDYFCKEFVAKENELPAMTKNRWLKSDTQIETYYRLLYTFTIASSRAHYYNNGKTFQGYEFIEIRLSSKLVVADSRFTVEIIQYNKGIAGPVLSSYILSSTNSCLEDKVSKEGYKILTFVYALRPVLNQYFLENAMVSDEQSRNKFINDPLVLGYPKPKSYGDSVPGGFFDWPDLRVRASLRLGNTGKDALVVKVAKLTYSELQIARVH